MILDILKVSKKTARPVSSGSVDFTFMFLKEEHSIDAQLVDFNAVSFGGFLPLCGIPDADVIGTYTVKGAGGVTSTRIYCTTASDINSFLAQETAEPKQVLVFYSNRTAHIPDITNKTGAEARTLLNSALYSFGANDLRGVMLLSVGFKDSDKDVVLLGDSFEQGKSYRISDLNVTISL